MPFFTHHARSCLLERYGEQFTEEEETSILEVVLGEMQEEECVAHLDVSLATRPDEYRLVVNMPQGAIMTITRTRSWTPKPSARSCRRGGARLSFGGNNAPTTLRASPAESEWEAIVKKVLPVYVALTPAR